MSTAVLAYLYPGKRLAKGLVSLAGSVVLLALAALLLQQVWLQGPVSAQMGGWTAPMGITLVADHLSVLLVLVTGIVAVAVSMYALSDIGEARAKGGFDTFLQMLLTGVVGAFLTGDLFNLYVWFEVMLISSFALIVLGGNKVQLDGAVKYVAINLVSTVLLLTAIGLVYGLAGTLNMADLNGALHELDDQRLVSVVSVLFLVAFGIKAAVFPLYFWLPASYHTLPISIAAVFAALMTKVGVYALIRTFTLVFTPDSDVIAQLILTVALVTMLAGILGAISHTNIRRILSYHVISSIGFMLLGLGLGSSLAMAASIFYMIQGILVKALLFLVIGMVEKYGHSSELSELGGLYRDRPGFSILYLLAALALVGIPPLSGFWAKLMVLEAGVAGQYWWMIAIVLLASLLTFIPLMRIWFEAFWKTAPVSLRVSPAVLMTSTSQSAALIGMPETAASQAVVVGADQDEVHTDITAGEHWKLAPVFGLSALLLLLGLAPSSLISLADSAAAGVLDVNPYIEVVLGAPAPLSEANQDTLP
jgi:multicomponent Na+:H+ antiporter subunit D